MVYINSLGKLILGNSHIRVIFHAKDLKVVFLLAMTQISGYT